MKKIVTVPNSVLAGKAKPVKKIDKATKDLIEEMKKALLSAKDPIGVGLAAPQVGVPLQIFLAKPTEKSPISVFINPKIKIIKTETKQNKRKDGRKKLEGCLSVPNIWGEVRRNSTLELTYKDEAGKDRKRKFSGFMATIIQHEIDHLQGFLFTKRVLEQKGTLYKSEKNEKGEDIFEEIDL